MVHHLVINLGMPIHITDKLFQVNRRDKPSALLDLAKQYHAWTAFVAFAPYFRELEPTTSTTTNGVLPYHLISGHFLDFAFHPQDLLHADWPVCVQQLLPYISDDELKMAEGQLMQTLNKIRQMEACFPGQGLYDHQGQIFAQILAIIQQARA